MSAAAVDYAPAPRHDAPGRPRLVVVPDGPPSGGHGRLRPTPFGRLVVLVVIAGIVAGMSLSLLGGGGHDHSVTVRPGQTLSDIAAQQLPDRPVGDAVAGILLANNLPSAQVQPGQVIVIPGS